MKVLEEAELCRNYSPFYFCESAQRVQEIHNISALVPIPEIFNREDVLAGCFNGLALHLGIGSGINFSCGNINVSKNIPDVEQVNARMEHMHCFGMAEGVRSNRKPNTNISVGLGLLDVFVNDMRDALPAERFSLAVEKQRIFAMCESWISPI